MKWRLEHVTNAVFIQIIKFGKSLNTVLFCPTVQPVKVTAYSATKIHDESRIKGVASFLIWGALGERSEPIVGRGLGVQPRGVQGQSPWRGS